MQKDDVELQINTTGWIEISCDKCGQTSCYDPAFYQEGVTTCFGCMPCVPEGMPLEEYLAKKARGEIA